MRPRLAFVSPLFLFPNDAGGKIRTTNILRGLKGGAFDITLLGPASADEASKWAGEIETICDRFTTWRPAPRAQWRRALDTLRRLPVNVAVDCNASARQLIGEVLAERHFDVVVFDFVHAAVLRPDPIRAPTVCFTHNVEAEIFARHAKQARSAPMRLLWASQFEKMKRFEGEALARFSRVVAVSDRDAAKFQELYGIANTSVIPTGVDLEHFAWREPAEVDEARAPTVVFTGAMDWAANIDGIRYFIEGVWPLVVGRVPSARFTVVGRNPPVGLVDLGRSAINVEFTGFVDDVRPYVGDAKVFVIPLRVGGGTRIKAFEAMAMGCPVVSTTIGIEGLGVQDGVHYLRRDTAEEQAEAIVNLLGDTELRRRLSKRARECVELRFGHIGVARVFEDICLRTIDRTPSNHAVAATT
jgi:glycosyltransferase involved in cell wall biosynthesis